MKTTILLSGSGTNFQAIVNKIGSGKLTGVSVNKVIADRECEGINRAIKYNIPYAIVNRKDERFADKMMAEIPKDTNLIVCAGFLSIIPNSVIQQFRNRIINIHPSLLPKYGGKGMYGKKVHEAVIANGETESGCTIHLVDEGVDTGAILFQRIVEVQPNDSPKNLQQRVLQEEHELLPNAVLFFRRLHDLRLDLPKLSRVKEEYAYYSDDELRQLLPERVNW